VAYVRGVVEDSNCVFKEIDRASDYGHDAFVLLVDDEEVTPVEIALQIKAGRSFCTLHNCSFVASQAHLNFWAKHGLTTIGVVYDPDVDSAWWIDLREAAKARRQGIGGSTISLPKSEWNRFDAYGFVKVLLPTLLGHAPRIDLEDALRWASNSDFDTHDVGVRVLLARYKQAPETWEAIFREFGVRGAQSSFGVFLGLIRIMGHHDEGYYSNEIPWRVRTPRQAQIMAFGKSEVVNLLKFVDDQGFERGAPGYGLFAIVPAMPDGLMILADIAVDQAVDVEVRDLAIQMIGFHDQDPHWWSLWTPTRQDAATR